MSASSRIQPLKRDHGQLRQAINQSVLTVESLRAGDRRAAGRAMSRQLPSAVEPWGRTRPDAEAGEAGPSVRGGTPGRAGRDGQAGRDNP